MNIILNNIYIIQVEKMSYNPMIGSTHNRSSYMPEYDSSSYKIPTQYGQFSGTTQSLYNPPSTTSIALFHIPSDGTNSLYIDGVPNDTTEREVSRNSFCLVRYISTFSRFSMHPPHKEEHFNWSGFFLMFCRF